MHRGEKARDSRSGWNYDDFSCCSLQEQQYFYKEATEACVGPDETKRSVSEALHLDMFLFAFLVFFPSAPSLDSSYYYVFYAASVILLALFFFFFFITVTGKGQNAPSGCILFSHRLLDS